MKDQYDRLIFVFGSNREGRHGKGAAKLALKQFGAMYGTSMGLQGYSYAIQTKELRKGCLPVTLREIRIQVNEFLKFASDHPNWLFLVTSIGCGLAGFAPEEIAPVFTNHPSNVLLPIEFHRIIGDTQC
jgi:hypothetical protein